MNRTFLRVGGAGMFRMMACFGLCLLLCNPLAAQREMTREQAYNFQHGMLPSIMFVQPARMLALLDSTKAQQAAAALQQSYPSPYPSPENISQAKVIGNIFTVKRYDLEHYRLYVVSMPEPASAPLCYQVGFLYEQKRMPNVERFYWPVAYYTVERWPDDDPLRHPVSKWTFGREKRNHETFTDMKNPADSEEFSERIFLIEFASISPTTASKPETSFQRVNPTAESYGETLDSLQARVTALELQEAAKPKTKN